MVNDYIGKYATLMLNDMFDNQSAEYVTLWQCTNNFDDFADLFWGKESPRPSWTQFITTNIEQEDPPSVIYFFAINDDIDDIPEDWDSIIKYYIDNQLEYNDNADERAVIARELFAKFEDVTASDAELNQYKQKVQDRQSSDLDYKRNSERNRITKILNSEISELSLSDEQRKDVLDALSKGIDKYVSDMRH